MTTKEIVKALLEHAEWAESNKNYSECLAALRAEAEREKVMEWGKMESSGGVLAICPECKYPVSWWHKTPFCGNCGRKLDGGGQDARKGVADER